MKLITQRYAEQLAEWPASGRHIMAQYDADSLVVYQAYRLEIGEYAARHGHFGGPFSYTRMSWIKPNFLWMMYRSGWGTKPGQEVTLAIRLKREFFDRLLAQAVPSGFDRDLYPGLDAWKRDVARSSVRLQWDPDHGPSGQPRERRAIQLGLRGPVLAEYGREAIIAIEDISDFVAEQRANAALPPFDTLVMPAERAYVPEDPTIRLRLDLTA